MPKWRQVKDRNPTAKGKFLSNIRKAIAEMKTDARMQALPIFCGNY
jgi:hypothetical protein